MAVPIAPELATVSDLLAHVADLPETSAAQARARIDAALELPARAARAALGLLALDLASPAGFGAATPAPDDVEVLVIPDVAAPAARPRASA